MELQMSAERRKRAAILTSEGEREAAVNSARQCRGSRVDAEARQKSAILDAEAQQKAIVLKAQADRQERVLKAQGTAEALQIIAEQLKTDPNAREALQFLLAQSYLDMGTTIGSSTSSKVMFMDPRSIPATVEGIRSIVGEANKPDADGFNKPDPYLEEAWNKLRYGYRNLVLRSKHS